MTMNTKSRISITACGFLLATQLVSATQDGYCQWIVNGSENSVRAVGMSIGPAGIAIYPAD